MKVPRIATSVSHIDSDLIIGAANSTKIAKKKILIKWSSIAACLAIVIMAGVMIVPMLNGNGTVSIGGIERNYKYAVDEIETAHYEFPWNYKTMSEKYISASFDGNKYVTRSRIIDKSLLGDTIGSCTATGFDIYTDKTYTESFEVRRITGISENSLIAVCMDGDYYVYFNRNQAQPDTLGELIEKYNLTKTLSLTKFSLNTGTKEKGYYQISDDSYIWQMLSGCSDARAYDDASTGWNLGDRSYISFTATSDELGVYKRVFYITEDGYVSTNIFDYRYIYYIGEEAANSIISYVKSNGEDTVREPYEITVGGTVTEIGDGYILVDDTVLCKNEKDGMVFKIATENIEIRRYIERGIIKVGDTVAVKFRKEINLGENNTLDGALAIYKGNLVQGNFSIPE